MIGIIGGVGPYAGLHLHKCILDQTQAKYDQEHLPVLHINNASGIPDRTDFLLGRHKENPAGGLSRQIGTIYDAGARVIGIPCNTAHSDLIYNEVARYSKNLQNLVLVNMIDELFKEMAMAGETKTGLLATLGSYQSGLFKIYAEKYGIDVVYPDYDVQEIVHDSIYNRQDGLKSAGLMNNRISTLYHSILDDYLRKNIHSLILGCTEISMAFSSSNGNGIRTFKTIDILAKALIREFQNHGQ